MNVSPLKILAVDNEQLLLHALTRACRGRAINVQAAETAEQALAEIEAGHYDLFLLDFDWQDRSHLELLKACDERCPYVPIIFMTTSDPKSAELNAVIRTTRKQGAWYLLEKPFQLDRMLGFIEAIFLDHTSLRFSREALPDNLEHEKRQEVRRPHVQTVGFSYKKIMDGVARRIHGKGIFTDVSPCGSGLIAHEPVPTGQVVSFDDDAGAKNGVVVWSMMLDEGTCRFGVQFC